jgi:hypothetical protein
MPTTHLANELHVIGAATQWRFTVTPDGQRVELDAASWLG